MQTVTVSRAVDAEPDAVATVVSDVEALTAAGGFDEVSVDGDVIRIRNKLGLATMELTLEVVDSDAALAVRQRDGHFSEMSTRYEVEAADGGSQVTATTEFELGKSIVGDVLDATLIKRQRTKELESQLDWIEAEVESA